MLEILTINDFFTKLNSSQQIAVLKALKTKERLDEWLDSLNHKKKNAGLSKPLLIDCSKCKSSPEPGKLLLTPRDNRDIHPSQIHKCLKKIWFDCSTYETTDPETGQPKIVAWAEHSEEYIPPRLRRIFDWGHAWHDTVQGYGSRGAFGPKKTYHPELRIDPDAGSNSRAEVLWIKGAVDAVIDPYVIEVPGMGKVAIRVVHEYKTINSNGYSKLNKPKTDHKWQATIYSYVLDVPIVVYLYINKDNQQLADFPISFSRELWETVEEKIDKIQHFVEAGHPPAWEETSAVLTPMECRECPYLKVCQPPQSQVKQITKKRR